MDSTTESAAQLTWMTEQCFREVFLVVFQFDMISRNYAAYAAIPCHTMKIRIVPLLQAADYHNDMSIPHL